MNSSLNKREIANLLNKYKNYGFIKGGELCLPKDKVLLFIDELRNNNIGVLGLDGWRFTDTSRTNIYQDLEVDLSIDENILGSATSIQSSLDIVKTYILEELPSEVDFISLTLNIPYLWKEIFE